ncbi:MAG: hypothetical protein HGA36_01400 [Candidatus Moranbacteria bacterium]|nr:hypothetical protein [Candidatus Moranbacteria bacterium]
MKNFFHKQREIIAVLSFVAIAAGLVYFVIMPLIARISGINDQIQQEVMKQEGVKMQIEQLPKVQKQYQALQEGGDLANVFLDQNKAVELIERLEKLAEITNNVITIAVQEKAPEVAKKTTSRSSAPTEETLISGLPSPNYLQMKITLIGNYDSIVSFIDALEKFEYYADIVAIQMNKNDEADTSFSVSNIGMFGVAMPNAAATPEVQPVIIKNSDVKAVIDSVFYTN